MARPGSRSFTHARSGGVFDYALAPYVKDTDIHWLFDIEIDPSNGEHAMFTTGYGGWETYDLGNLDKNLPTHWSVMSPGIEETVALALYSPAKGPRWSPPSATTRASCTEISTGPLPTAIQSRLFSATPRTSAALP